MTIFGHADHDARLVIVGPLVLFSTETGDAWLLDPADRLAARLARDGDPQELYFEETAARFAVGWKGNYQIDGDAFIFIDRDTARVTTILGYLAAASLNWPDRKISNIFGWNFMDAAAGWATIRDALKSPPRQSGHRKQSNAPRGRC